MALTVNEQNGDTKKLWEVLNIPVTLSVVVSQVFAHVQIHQDVHICAAL